MTTPRKLLLIEDDAEMRDLLVEQFRLREAFDIAAAATGADALRLAENGFFDLILLDIGLPDMDGRDLCRLLRRKSIFVPIILLTAMTSDADIILGLDAGANDYITKPFRMNVLVARIHAHLRQHKTSEDASFMIGPYIFRPAGRALVDPETRKQIALSEKECAIMRFLYRAGNAVVSCEALYSGVWDHSTPLTTHTLQTHIYRLRQKIEPDPANPQIIVSEGGGYRVPR